MVKDNVLKQFILISILLCSTLGAAVSYAANITVTTSRNPVALDDSFHLIYEADSDVDDPDFSPVNEYFDILNSAQSTNMRFINGNYSLKKSWDLSVIAKNIGKFTIPPISFGNEQSPAIQITVSNSTSPNSVAPNASNIPAEIFVESVLDKKQGWVQSQFIYTVRLLRTVAIASASLTEPETNDPDALIESLGEDQYQTTRNGIRYNVYERRYAIFPQRSGTLKVRPTTFEGRVNATQPRTIFDQFRLSGQLKRLRSNAVEANVKAAPTTINLQDWLPAKDLTLTEQWSADIGNMKAGEPVTRTITISAEGLTGLQLPEIKFTDIDGLKQYPDKAVYDNKPSSTGIDGTKQIKVALIPTRAGTFILPEIKLSWWNTQTDKQETAVIPEITITAEPGTQSAPATNNYTQQTVAPQPGKENVTQSLDTPTAEGSMTAAAMSQPAYWKWLSLLFASLWIYTLILLLRKKTATSVIRVDKTQPSFAELRTCAAAVEKNAGNNNAKATQTALISWAQKYYANNNITNLTQISDYCSATLTEEIRVLNQALYSNAHANWSGINLITAFNQEQANDAVTSETKKSALRPLYKNK